MLRPKSLQPFYPADILQFKMQNYFNNHRSVQLIIAYSQKEKVSLKGTAKAIDKSLLEVLISEKDWPDTNKITEQSNFFINFDSREGVISLRTALESIPERGRLIFKILDYEQDGSNLESLRAPGVGIKAFYFHLNDQGKPLNQTRKETKLINISPKGLLIQVDEIIEPYKIIGLELALPSKDSYIVKCSARVVRMALNPEGQIVLGLEFLNLDQNQKNRLADYCHKNK